MKAMIVDIDNKKYRVTSEVSDSGNYQRFFTEEHGYIGSWFPKSGDYGYFTGEELVFSGKEKRKRNAAKFCLQKYIDKLTSGK